jgi:hypothetical protein
MRSAIIAVAIALAACQDSLVTREIGARCDSSDECDDRCLLDSAGFPGGLCTVACEQRTDCTARTTCVELEGGVCLYECNVDADCVFLGPLWSCVETEVRSNPDQKVRVCRGS